MSFTDLYDIIIAGKDLIPYLLLASAPMLLLGILYVIKDLMEIQ